MPLALGRGLGFVSAMLLAALATFALAAATWLADAQLPCDPASPFQWHGLWHALTATAAGFVFLYY
ncbi:MAG: hypothetical protein NZL88_07805, partial [Gaiellaceae bacterium]|nr:hypothetical protein [Gaiellaceae bacterium]